MRILGALIFAAVVLSVGLAGRQTQPLPGPGTGIVPVAGTVNVGNSPSVYASQLGEWRMAISNTPDVRVTNTSMVRIATPDFLREGGRYAIIWHTGERETVSIAQLGADGWVRLQQVGGPRWINTTQARSIETLP